MIELANKHKTSTGWLIFIISAILSKLLIFSDRGYKQKINNVRIRTYTSTTTYNVTWMNNSNRISKIYSFSPTVLTKKYKWYRHRASTQNRRTFILLIMSCLVLSATYSCLIFNRRRCRAGMASSYFMLDSLPSHEASFYIWTTRL